MDPVLLRLLGVVALVAVVTVLGRLAKSRDGRVRTTDGPTTASAADGPRVDHDVRAELGLAAADRSAVLFGSPTCTPCDAVKALLREVEADDDGFAWTYVDAADRLDLAREHGVMRVPTLLVLDADGAVTARASGVPTREDLRAALGHESRDDARAA